MTLTLAALGSNITFEGMLRLAAARPQLHVRHYDCSGSSTSANRTCTHRVASRVMILAAHWGAHLSARLGSSIRLPCCLSASFLRLRPSQAWKPGETKQSVQSVHMWGGGKSFSPSCSVSAIYFGRGRASAGCTACSLPARNSATALATARATLRASSCTGVSRSSASWLLA